MGWIRFDWEQSRGFKTGLFLLRFRLFASLLILAGSRLGHCLGIREGGGAKNMEPSSDPDSLPQAKYIAWPEQKG